MNISEMSTDLGFDMMEKLLPDVASILADEDVKRVKESFAKKNAKIAVGASFDPVLGLFLGKHRETMFRIAATVSQKTVAEVKKQPLHDTVETVQQGLSDDMMTFFASCLRLVMTA